MANPENKQIPYESTQKDIRDAIESVATAIGGIAIPSADHVSYDNSVSGLSATDVQNAIDELSSEKVDKEAGKGLSTNDYTDAEKTKLAGIEAGAEVNPTSSAKTATESFETVDGGLLSKCQINLVPVQSGSGDPYPAGGGKNKLPMSVSGIKAVNTSGTWSGNTYTIYTTTFTVLTDDGENVLGIKVNGKPVGGNAIFYLSSYSFDGTSITLNGCPSGGSSSTYRLDAFGDFLAQDIGSGVAITNTGNANIRIVIFENVTVSNVIFYPMLRLSTESDPTFVPYSNIRPISGHTEVGLETYSKNLCSGVATGRYNGDGSIDSNNTRVRTNRIFLVKAGIYTISFSTSASGKTPWLIYDYWLNSHTDGTNANTYDSGWQTAQSITITLTEDKYLSLGFRYSDNSTMNASDLSVQIEKGTRATSYEPYKGKTYTVEIGETVYGGYVDLVTGVMIATHAIIDLGSLTWTKDASKTFYVNLSNSKSGLQNMYCEALTPYPESYKLTDYSLYPDNIIARKQNATYIYTKCTTYENDTATAFKTAMSGVDLVYELETYQTIQLTPQQIEALVGQNNLSTPLDGQSIETNGVEYKELFTFADVKEYVDKKIPDAPTTDGTYTLQAVVSGGVPTYSWV